MVAVREGDLQRMGRRQLPVVSLQPQLQDDSSVGARPRPVSPPRALSPDGAEPVGDNEAGMIRRWQTPPRVKNLLEGTAVSTQRGAQR